MKAPIVSPKSYTYKSKFEELNDPYFWLREKENKDVIKYIEEENSYCDELLSDTNHSKISFKELKLRIKEDDNSVPQKMGIILLFENGKRKDYPLFCRRGCLDASEEVILDQNEVAKGHEFCDVAVVEVSKDHRYLAYSADYNGDESYTVIIKDLETNKLFDEKIEGCSTSLIWKNSGAGFYYSKLDEMKDLPIFIITS